VIKSALLVLSLIILSSCKDKFEATLKIYENSDFVVKTSDQETIPLQAGSTRSTLVINTRRPEKSYFTLNIRTPFTTLSKRVPLNLPQLDNLLAANDAIRLDSTTIGQSFGMMIMRTPGRDKESFSITFHDPGFNQTIGEMTFETDKIPELKESDFFIKEYQEVKRKHRAAVIKIDGEIESQLSMPRGLKWLEKTIDHVVNYSGVVLISPWVYARYKHITWEVGSDHGDFASAWKATVEKYPVIDYFAFVHSHNQWLPRKKDTPFLMSAPLSMDDLGLKQNQLRAVYTGACRSGDSSEWLTNYAAVVAAGQRNLSASPLFQFVVVTKWIYGFSFEDSISKAWQAAIRRVKALEWVTFAKLWQKNHGVLLWDSADDMLFDSEIIYSFTKEALASEIDITKTQKLSKIPFESDLTTKSATEAIAEKSGELYLNKLPGRDHND